MDTEMAGVVVDTDRGDDDEKMTAVDGCEIEKQARLNGSNGTETELEAELQAAIAERASDVSLPLRMAPNLYYQL